MSLFKNKLYLATVLGHFTVDVFASMASVVVTFFSISMLLSGAQIGLTIGAYQFIGALTQPLFGWFTDKTGSRWLGPLSVAWTAGFMALSIWVAQTYNFNFFFLCFSLSALGVGAFHPQGAMHAGTTFIRRAATATAVFFLFGQSGLSSGPLLAGVLLENGGATGITLLALLTLPLIFFMAITMRRTAPHSHPSFKNQADGAHAPSSQATRPVRWGAISLLALILGLRSWVFIGTVSFLPKLFQSMGWNAVAYGSITSVFWLASGVAGVIAGQLADRWGRRPVVFGTLLAGSIPLFFLPLNSSWMAFPLAIAVGGLLGASHSITVVIAQALLPGRQAFASGMTLGYIFGTGAIAATVIGALADVWGLATVIQTGAFVGIAAALLALFLPSTRVELQPKPESVPA
jgi:FSR family fosmidomycin resistance protein-like MFS transporter